MDDATFREQLAQFSAIESEDIAERVTPTRAERALRRAVEQEPESWR